MQMQEDMIRTIEQHVRDTAAEIGRDELSPRLIAALRKVPRDRFVPQGEERFAFSDSPLPIGHGQTISQPFIVALMTELIDPQPGDRVLEVGSGSGYQAAILAELVSEVYGIEIVPALARRAADVLRELGYANVTVKAGDGWHGWPEHAPFDGIIVTAAPAEVPPPLVEQLKPGARMVIPIGEPWTGQSLLVLEKRPDGTLTRKNVLPVAFVPLTGPHAEGR